MAEVVTEGDLRKSGTRNPLLRQYLGSIDNPALIVYRIRPKPRYRFMKESAIDFMRCR